MARGRKIGGRQKGTRNRATAELVRRLASSGVLPLDYMLTIMRDPAADHRRRGTMAMAAAPYLQPKVNAIDAKSPAVEEASPERTSVEVRFVVPGSTRDDQQ